MNILCVVYRYSGAALRWILCNLYSRIKIINIFVDKHRRVAFVGVISGVFMMINHAGCKHRHLNRCHAKCYEKVVGSIYQNEEVVVLSVEDQGEGTAIFVVVVVLFPW